MTYAAFVSMVKTRPRLLPFTGELPHCLLHNVKNLRLDDVIEFHEIE